jgi:hypothetical protein
LPAKEGCRLKRLGGCIIFIANGSNPFSQKTFKALRTIMLAKNRIQKAEFSKNSFGLTTGSLILDSGFLEK